MMRIHATDGGGDSYSYNGPGGGEALRMIQAYIAHMQRKGFARKTVQRRVTSLGGLARFIDPAPLEDVTLDQIMDWLGTYPNPQTNHSYGSDVKKFFNYLHVYLGVEHDAMTQGRSGVPDRPPPTDNRGEIALTYCTAEVRACSRALRAGCGA
jgi:hypothetical protein